VASSSTAEPPRTVRSDPEEPPNFQQQPGSSTGRRFNEISADFDPSNILDTAGRSTRSKRRRAYLAALECAEELPGFHAAFSAGLYHQPGWVHQDNLAPPPRNWRELKGHSKREGFLQAARKEYDDLQHWGTFSVMLRPANTKLLPRLWVFTYKFGPDGFLQKHKARICVRGDLQQTHPSDDFYAATLAAKTFCVLAAITATFDLEAQQFDAVNAFTNSHLDKPIFVSMPQGYGRSDECLKLLRALYGLRQSPKLWLKEFTKTLLELSFRQVPGSECLFMSDHLLLFFYVDDIVVLYRCSAEAQFRVFHAALLDLYEMRELGDLKWFLNSRIKRDYRSER
jgi:hypothetical protein